MNVAETTEFSLMPIGVPYKQWKGKTELLRDGLATGQMIFGCDLKAQYKAGAYFLLVTEYDCPFEERVTLTLLDASLTILDHRTMPSTLLPDASSNFENIIWHNEQRFDLYLYKELLSYRYTIKPPGFWLRKPHLSKQFFPMLRSKG